MNNRSPEWCNLRQALLWIDKGREPVLDEVFVSLPRPELPSEPRAYSQFILAVRAREVDLRGTLVHMIEDVDPNDDRVSLAFPYAPPTEISEYEEVRETTIAPFLETRQHQELDRESRPSSDQLNFNAINWRESFIDLPGFPQNRVNLTAWGRQWNRLKDVEVKVAELKAQFPRASQSPLADGVDRTPVVSPRDAEPDRPPRLSRGRPREYDWDAFDVEAVRQLAENPAQTQAALAALMLVWCQETWGKEPAPSMITDRLRMLSAQLSENSE